MVPRKWTDDDLRAAAAGANSVADVCRALGIQPKGGNYQVVWRHLKRLQLDVARPRPRVDDEAFARAVAESRSLAEVAGRIGVGNHSRIRVRINRLGLDASHFRGQGWRLGSRVPVKPARPLSEVLVEDSYMSATAGLRQRLIGEGLKEYRCEVCGLTEWNGVPIPLELDHINGRRDDNRIENLRLICPNCHAQTPTYRGRNIGRYSETG